MEELLFSKKIVACIRKLKDLPEALAHKNIDAIIALNGDINYLPSLIKRSREAGKLLLVHIDLFEGVGKDRPGLHFLTRLGLRGIVTTKSHLIKIGKEEGLLTVQRIFVVDSESLKTAIKVARQVQPHAIEVLPSSVPGYVISELQESLAIPILAGGLVKTEEDVHEALDKGISAISTSLRDLWNLNLLGNCKD
ncbi:glycerol-3-phosphate responsive antiterminator [Desulforamulus ruminis]|uniref:Glycerol-3-phosphate responsive antiterminator n=1 Tax=Desulforamulus ruminis (strain ATCC 23193 / DSM 2154 / NCIMB 8452 / DL) TaxID=696281 RepID=F6DKM5_DESRL|nr:glycerol-3-phosphate responsive antiterminator [Desulforamulus ruminis]AEG60400.1 glycerol-3-phosphate responsive antiterminator [Desulforamulus ruminis DSM 2154]